MYEFRINHSDGGSGALLAGCLSEGFILWCSSDSSLLERAVYRIGPSIEHFVCRLRSQYGVHSVKLDDGGEQGYASPADPGGRGNKPEIRQRQGFSGVLRSLKYTTENNEI